MSAETVTKITMGEAEPSRLSRLWREEIRSTDLRLWRVNGLPRLLPTGLAARARTALYRLLGVQVGPRTLIWGALTLAGPAESLAHLRIGTDCFINHSVHIDTNAAVTLGDRVTLGHHVVIITADHAIGPRERRCGALRPAPVTIEEGAWVAAGVTVLPGVTIGQGAVVAAGAVVTRNVAPNTLVGGVPARFIRELEGAP